MGSKRSLRSEPLRVLTCIIDCKGLAPGWADLFDARYERFIVFIL